MKVIKEIGIIILLCAIILLILGILFYDYNPINKVIPNKVTYTVPENISEELKETIDNSSPTVENKVYTVDDVDLKVYQKSKTYNPSKENPFAASSSTSSGTTTNSSGTTSTTPSTGTSSSASSTKTDTASSGNTGSQTPSTNTTTPRATKLK